MFHKFLSTFCFLFFFGFFWDRFLSRFFYIYQKYICIRIFWGQISLQIFWNFISDLFPLECFEKRQVITSTQNFAYWYVNHAMPCLVSFHKKIPQWVCCQKKVCSVCCQEKILYHGYTLGIDRLCSMKKVTFLKYNWNSIPDMLGNTLFQSITAFCPSLLFLCFRILTPNQSLLCQQRPSQSPTS